MFGLAQEPSPTPTPSPTPFPSPVPTPSLEELLGLDGCSVVNTLLLHCNYGLGCAEVEPGPAPLEPILSRYGAPVSEFCVDFSDGFAELGFSAAEWAQHFDLHCGQPRDLDTWSFTVGTDRYYCDLPDSWEFVEVTTDFDPATPGVYEFVYHWRDDADSYDCTDGFPPGPFCYYAGNEGEKTATVSMVYGAPATVEFAGISGQDGSKPLVATRLSDKLSTPAQTISELLALKTKVDQQIEEVERSIEKINQQLKYAEAPILEQDEDGDSNVANDGDLDIVKDRLTSRLARLITEQSFFQDSSVRMDAQDVAFTTGLDKLRALLKVDEGEDGTEAHSSLLPKIEATDELYSAVFVVENHSCDQTLNLIVKRSDLKFVSTISFDPQSIIGNEIGMIPGSVQPSSVTEVHVYFKITGIHGSETISLSSQFGDLGEGASAVITVTGLTEGDIIPPLVQAWQNEVATLAQWSRDYTTGIEKLDRIWSTVTAIWRVIRVLVDASIISIPITNEINNILNVIDSIVKNRLISLRGFQFRSGWLTTDIADYLKQRGIPYLDSQLPEALSRGCDENDDPADWMSGFSTTPNQPQSFHQDTPGTTGCVIQELAQEELQ